MTVNLVLDLRNILPSVFRIQKLCKISSLSTPTNANEKTESLGIEYAIQSVRRKIIRFRFCVNSSRILFWKLDHAGSVSVKYVSVTSWWAHASCLTNLIKIRSSSHPRGIFHQDKVNEEHFICLRCQTILCHDFNTLVSSEVQKMGISGPTKWQHPGPRWGQRCW